MTQDTTGYDDWRWFGKHRWILIVAGLWIFRLFLGTVERGGLDPELHAIVPPNPLAGTIGNCLVWVIAVFALACLTYEVRRYRREHRRPRLTVLD
jgi:hypothetical protein